MDEIAAASRYQSANCPRRRCQRARTVGRARKKGGADALLDQPPPLGREALDISADGSLTAEQRLPVIAEIGIVHADRDRAALHCGNPGVAPKRRQAVGQGERARKQTVVSGAGCRVHTGGSVPEQTLEHEAAAKMPYRPRD